MDLDRAWSTQTRGVLRKKRVALDPDSYLPEFFTEERLQRYRNLHERFPLWCGDWPEEEAKLPEAHLWSRERRFQQETKEIGKRLLSITFDGLTTDDSVPRPIFHIGDYVEDTLGEYHFLEQTFKETDPPAGAALIASIEYLYQGSMIVTSPVWKKSFLDWIARFGTSLLQKNGNPTLLGLKLSNAHRKVLSTPPSEGREEAIESLEKLWNRLGREIGAIPWTKGGPRTFLSPGFQAGLLEEAKGLVPEVRTWEPTPEDVEWIRSTLPVTESNIPDWAENLAKERGRRGNHNGARKLREEQTQVQQKALEDAQDVGKWLRMIDFPMLTDDEIQGILDHENPRSTLGPASDLVGNRLGMSGSTIQNNTRPFR